MARSGHCQLYPGMPQAGAGIGKLQMAHAGEQAVVVNGFISHVNMVCAADLSEEGPELMSAACWNSASGNALCWHYFQKKLL